MKKLIFITLLISNFIQSQEVNYERFKIEDNKIIWQNVYNKDSITTTQNIRKIPALKMFTDYTGEVENQKPDCSSIAIYMISTFRFNVLIEEKEDKIRITVSEILFDSNMQINFGTISTSRRYVSLDEMEIRTSDKKFRKNNQSKTNLTCLDNFLLNFFKPKQKSNW